MRRRHIQEAGGLEGSRAEGSARASKSAGALAIRKSFTGRAYWGVWSNSCPPSQVFAILAGNSLQNQRAILGAVGEQPLIERPGKRHGPVPADQAVGGAKPSRRRRGRRRDRCRSSRPDSKGTRPAATAAADPLICARPQHRRVPESRSGQRSGGIAVSARARKLDHGQLAQHGARAIQLIDDRGIVVNTWAAYGLAPQVVGMAGEAAWRRREDPATVRAGGRA